MQYDPNGVEEFAHHRPGTFEFRVMNAEEKFFNGNETINLELAVLIDGLEAKCFSTLYNTDKARWRIKSFCRCINRLDLWESGNLTAESLINTTGIATFVWKDNAQKYITANVWMLPGSIAEGPKHEPAKAMPPAPQPETKSEGPTPPDEDGIPF